MSQARPNSKIAPAKSARRRPQARLFAHLSAIACLFAATLSAALEPSTPLANYARQSWVMENGLPQNTVQELVQTHNGFIWLGTEVGLVRFDGNSFAVFDRNSTPALPGNDIRCLLAASDGSLWVGTSDGLARMKDGEVATFTTANGLPANGVRSLQQGANSVVTVSTDNGYIGFDGTRVVPIQFDMLEGQAVMFEVKLSDGSRAYFDKGTVELTQNGHTQRWTAGKDLPGTRIQALFADRKGAVWIGTNGGLARWVAGKLQRLPITDPLATESVLALMEDQEGNLWVGTESGGLHILRDQRFRTFGARDGLSSDTTTTVVEDNTGRLWAGTSGSGLNVFAHDATKAGPVLTYSVRNGLLSDVILSLATAPNGDIWVGTPDGLNRIRRGVVDSFTSADGLPDDFIRSLMADADGSLWIGTRRGLTHWTGAVPGARMQTYTQANGLGSDLVGAMARDSAGNLWVATLAGLSRIRSGKIDNYTTANGLSSNVVTALLPHGNTMLIGTQDRGWNLWDGQRFSAPARNGHDPAQAAIRAILEDAGNHLWFATGNGIARCDCDMMGGCSNWMEFGPADGLRSRETATNSHPSAWRSRDGHLWFATPKGLVEVDPAHFPVNTVPPPVAIERLSVDDLPQPLRGADFWLRIPPGRVHFEFDYAALSFIAPQKVRYRYMLEGFDHAWTEAGSRRTAYYTNIPPGRYTFRVQAANNDGLWNTEGTSLKFELRPHFYQTLWFYLLLAASSAALIVLLLRRRLRVAQREFTAVLGERNRIAREITIRSPRATSASPSSWKFCLNCCASKD